MADSMRVIINELNRHKRIFDADVVGDRVLDIAAREVSRRFDTETDPDGTRWPDLSEAYARWKAEHGRGLQMGVEEGVMAGDDLEFIGTRGAATQTEIVSTYGTTVQARDEAEWFEEGDPARNRPPRPFTAMSDECVAAIDEFLEKHHERSL